MTFDFPAELRTSFSKHLNDVYSLQESVHRLIDELPNFKGFATDDMENNLSKLNHHLEALNKQLFCAKKLLDEDTPLNINNYELMPLPTPAPLDMLAEHLMRLEEKWP